MWFSELSIGKMGLSVDSALYELGVHLRDRAPDKWHKCKCPYPECAGKRNKNMQVIIGRDAIGYLCWRCNAKGRIWYDSERHIKPYSSFLSSFSGNTQSSKSDWRPDYNGPPR